MNKILPAYDGTPEADSALEAAAELATSLHARIGVVSVVPVHPGRIGIDPWDDATVHNEELLRARELLAALDVQPELHRAGVEIERIAADRPASGAA